MKRTEVHVSTTTEEITICDVCNNQIYENPQPLFRAGTFSTRGYVYNFGLNLTITQSFGGQVEHICRNCLAAALRDIAEKI